MNETESLSAQPHTDSDGLAVAQNPARQPFTEPKLTFVEPRLVNYGKFEDMTGAFAGTIIVPSQDPLELE